MSNYFSSAQAKLKTREVVFVVDGGGEAVTPGEKAWVRIPFTGVITGYELVADQVGYIVIDVWKGTYATFPPTVANSITGILKPELSLAVKDTETDLSVWDTELVAGDYLKFNVDSASLVTKIMLSLSVRL